MYETTSPACGQQAGRLENSKIPSTSRLGDPTCNGDNVPDKLLTMEKLTEELHNVISRLGDRLTAVRPEQDVPLPEGHPSPPSLSPLGNRLTRANDAIAGAITRLERLVREVDL